MKNKNLNKYNENIIETTFSDALSERYLSYAMSTIVSRSLPDVRDGLKPVHRRLLFAMRELKLNPEQGFKKCARVVGDVIGKYHPHGDTAVYDAMVRLAQDFAIRYPLVEGQGNFGSIDGDNPAAMRYTEARLTSYALILMDGLEEGGSDFLPTYDGEYTEPKVMPAGVLNLLANGASGIAVGMATNIPPHNLSEISDALIHMCKIRQKYPNRNYTKGRPEILDSTLSKYIKGPDFPTGGVIVEDNRNIIESYKSGRGVFRLRARWDIEKRGRGKFVVIIREIPFQVSKSKIISRIAELMEAKKLPFLNDIFDESDEDIRIVLEPKVKISDVDIFMEQIFKQTDLESRFSMNMNVLCDDGVPRVLNLREILQSYLNHRQKVLISKSNFRLNNIKRRIQILKGYLIVYLNMDQVIKIIREKDNPKSILIKKYKLDDIQAESILNMRLRALRKLEEQKIKKEYKNLAEEEKNLNSLIRFKKKQWNAIEVEIKQIQKEFSSSTFLGQRKTLISDPPKEIFVPIDVLVEKEPVTLVLSEKGWVRSLKGHKDDISDLKFKEGDNWSFFLNAMSVDNILFFSSNGRSYVLSADKISQKRGFGEPISLFFDLPSDAKIIEMKILEPSSNLIVASNAGRGFIVNENILNAQTKTGKQILSLSDKEEATVCYPIFDDDDHVAVVGNNRKLLIFKINDLPRLNKGRGVIMQRYNKGFLSDLCSFKKSEGLSWRIGNKKRTELKISTWIGKRAQAGKLAPKGFSNKNKFR
ncbi:MAG: DNA topoisomerase IV subunit A [Alphaproteobacteria bacterium TMED87]|nr:DNA topoisomerase IV subunit A [Rhodospirillaceae bacterium]OUV10765.1 MAG: DNA topoisomerase IV subunit A [Alphaproteobacteria bacterium TMED87]